MNTYSRNIINGALSGLAGTVTKLVFKEISFKKPPESKPYTTKPKLAGPLGLVLGVLGGIGTHFAFKKQDRLVTKVTSGFVVGSISDMLLKATRITEPEQNKKFTMFLGNGLYGLVTAMVDKALGRFILETNHLDNYIEYMQVREEIKKKKHGLKRHNQENDLQRTS